MPYIITYSYVHPMHVVEMRHAHSNSSRMQVQVRPYTNIARLGLG